MRLARSLSVGLVALLMPGVALGAPAQPAVLDDAFMRPITLVMILALAALLPFAFMTLTAFVKISTVLQIVRGAPFTWCASAPPSTSWARARRALRSSVK